MRNQSNIVRVAIILAILVSGLTLAASPGAALSGIPSSATIHSATLILHTSDSTASAMIRAHRVNVAWSEDTVTWNNFYASPAPYDPAVEASDTSANDPLVFDVTGVVQGWVSGAYPNNGLFLEQDLTGYTKIHSSSDENSVQLRPMLEVCYSIDPTGHIICVSIQAGSYGTVADAYIFEGTPDTNYGASQWLYTGLWPTGYEKQSLIQFEIPAVPEGCTLTPGYWKTHSKYGPAPYDATWALIGEDTAFFASGQTWYEALWTEPKGGNAYYILAHAYIAAALNFENGTDPTAAQAAFDAATALFGMYEDSIPKKDTNRAVAIGLAETLDNYNNGIIGPGHCAE